MSGNNTERDKMGRRLGLIVSRLFSGESLSIPRLATEFNVSERTIRRDIHQRLDYLNIYKKEDKYQLTFFNRVTRTDRDIIRFAKMTYIDRLFPSFDRKFVSLLLDSDSHSPFVVYTSPLEKKIGVFSVFYSITQSIIDSHKINFMYQGKYYQHFHPYRLIYFKKHWYLVGLIENKMLVVLFDLISDVDVTKHCFKRDMLFLDLTENEQFIHSLPYFQYSIDLYFNFKPYYHATE